MQQRFWKIKIMTIKIVQQMHLEILLVSYIVEQPKFCPLPFHISLLLWQLIWKDASSDYNIKAYKDKKQKQSRSEIILTYCCLWHVHVLFNTNLRVYFGQILD